MTVTSNQPVSDIYRIRQCTLADEEDAISICVQSGNAGDDARSFFDDPKLLGYRYASPYIHLCSELAFVLEDSARHVCGYVLAALDSSVFYSRYVNEWLPKMKQLYPNIPPNEHNAKYDWQIINNFHNDTVTSFKLFDQYPSHLHIDLLPKAQGQGYGTKMIRHIENALRQLGSTGIHLETSVNNTRARHFYTKLGFTTLTQDQETIWFGKTLA